MMVIPSRSRAIGSLLALVGIFISTITAQEIQFLSVPEAVTEGTENIVISFSGLTPGVVRSFDQIVPVIR
jgi:hypothetical protein